MTLDLGHSAVGTNFFSLLVPQRASVVLKIAQLIKHLNCAIWINELIVSRRLCWLRSAVDNFFLSHLSAPCRGRTLKSLKFFHIAQGPQSELENRTNYKHHVNQLTNKWLFEQTQNDDFELKIDVLVTNTSHQSLNTTTIKSSLLLLLLLDFLLWLLTFSITYRVPKLLKKLT